MRGVQTNHFPPAPPEPPPISHPPPSIQRAPGKLQPTARGTDTEREIVPLTPQEQIQNLQSTERETPTSNVLSNGKPFHKARIKFILSAATLPSSNLFLTIVNRQMQLCLLQTCSSPIVVGNCNSAFFKPVPCPLSLATATLPSSNLFLTRRQLSTNHR